MFTKTSSKLVLISSLLLASAMVGGFIGYSSQPDPEFDLGQQNLVMEYSDGTPAIALDAGGTSPDSFLRVGSGFDQAIIDPFDRVTFQFETSSTLDNAIEINTLSEGLSFVVTKGGSVGWRVRSGAEDAEILCRDARFFGDALLTTFASCPDNVASLPVTVDAQAAKITELETQVANLTSMLNTMRSDLDALKSER